MSGRAVIKCGIFALFCAGITTLLADTISFALAHGSLPLVALYLPIWPANMGIIPRIASEAHLFAYQLVYYFLIALVFVSIRAIVRRKATND